MPEDRALLKVREIHASLVCTLCARTIGRSRGPAGRPLTSISIQLHDASHAGAARRLRCPYCSGRLWLQDCEEVAVDCYVLTDEDLHPRRGRPRKLTTAS
jgi:hypothetical protein